MVDCIEELFQVNIDNPVVSVIHILNSFQYCLLCTLSWSKAIAISMKYSFIDWCQHLCYCLLYHTICYCRNSQLSLASIFFWNFYLPYW